MYFCIRDDDTSFFTSPDDLEHAYGESVSGSSFARRSSLPLRRDQ